MNAEQSVKVVTTSIEEKALTIIDQSRAVKVTDAETYTVAGSLWKAIGDMIKEVKDTFDPICDAAHKAHKAAVEKRAKYLDPLANAQKNVKGLMSNYDAEQERIRRAEQARIEVEMRKKEEERRIQEAIEVEAALKELEAALEPIRGVWKRYDDYPMFGPSGAEYAEAVKRCMEILEGKGGE